MGRRAVDPLPPVALWGEDAPDDPAQRVAVGGGGSRRTPLLIAAGLVVALLGGLALGDDSSTPTQAAKGERDNAARVPLKDSTTTTTTRPRPTTTAAPPPVPILPGSGVRLVLTGGTGPAELLDLETGMASDIGLTRNDLYGVVAVRGGIVAVEAGVARYLPLPNGTAVDLGSADQVWPSGDPDAVWLVVPSDDPYRGTSRARLVTISGQSRGSAVGPDQGYIAGAYADGVIAQTGGRIYGINEMGAIRPIVAGEVIGVSEQRLMARTCDDRAVCGVSVWDEHLENPQRIQAPLEAMGYYGVSTVAEPGGSRVALLSYDPRGTVLSIIDLTGGPVTPVDISGEISSMAWLPGDLGLVVAQRSQLLRAHFEGSRVVVDVLRDRGADFVAVIP